LIHSFTGIASSQYCPDGNRLELIKRTDGGLYYPIGIFNVGSKIPLASQLQIKYQDFYKWECDGIYTVDDGSNKLNWLGLRKIGMDSHTNFTLSSRVLDVLNYKEVLIKVIQSNFNFDCLTDDEKFSISKCIDKGFLSISEKDGYISPNFYVFNTIQWQELENVLLECYGYMKPKNENLYIDIRKMCKACLPKQIAHYLDFISYFCLSLSHSFITRFAFFDGILYKPNMTTDYTILTLSIVTSEILESSLHNKTVKLVINHKS